MRNSYLEHQVKKLKDENNSFGEDVTWHLEQLGDLEQDLNEAQAERAAALAEVLDLKAQTASLVQSQIPVSAVLDGDESAYTGMTSSGSSIHTIDSDANIASGLTYGLQHRQRSMSQERTNSCFPGTRHCKSQPCDLFLLLSADLADCTPQFTTSSLPMAARHHTASNLLWPRS